MPSWSRNLIFDEPRAPETPVWDRTASSSNSTGGAMCPCAACFSSTAPQRTVFETIHGQDPAAATVESKDRKTKGTGKKYKTQYKSTGSVGGLGGHRQRLRRKKSVGSMASDYVPLCGAAYEEALEDEHALTLEVDV